MRLPRLKAPVDLPVAYYHCVSRVVDRQFVFGNLEKERFVELMRQYEAFCQVRVVTYCVMSNHFHLLLEIPQRRTHWEMSDEDLLHHLRAIYNPQQLASIRSDLSLWRANGADQTADAYKHSVLQRMWDVSAFMKLLKQRFTQWFNRMHQRKGTLWEERFRSVLVEGTGDALWAMAAYIDLNPVRAGIVEDPKDYRWCGYAEATAGRKSAQEGLRVVVESLATRKVVKMHELLGSYRTLLFVAGEEEGLDPETKRALKRGLSREQIEKVLEARGRLSFSQMLRCRVRYFSDGVALGSLSFVNRIFTIERHRFSAKRTSGARALRQVDAPGLRTLRDLRLFPVG